MTVQRYSMAIVALLAIATAGCANSGRTPAARKSLHPFLLYNPRHAGVPPVEVARSDWPYAVKYTQDEQVFDFQVSTYDRQSTYGSVRDHYSRRFDSVRRGSGYR